MTTALFTKANAYRRVLATNGTTNGFSARVDVTAVTTTPSGGESAAGYVYLPPAAAGGQPPNTVLIKPYGVGANDATGAMRVYGVKEIEKPGATKSYTHVLLGEWTFVLSSTLTGVASGVVVATEYYADTITKVTGLENVSEQVLSPTADEPAHLLLDCKGHALLLIELSTAGSATSVNALFAGV
jgi:hypothetical protein